MKSKRPGLDYFDQTVTYLYEHGQLLSPQLLEDLGELGALKTIPYYVRVLKTSIRKLYSGDITEYEFVDTLEGYVQHQFRRAWNTAMRENGLDPSSDMTPEMDEILVGLVLAERIYIKGLAQDIKENEQALDVYLNRADLWALAYLAVVNQALAKTGTIELFIWQLGPTEHCSTCQSRSGVIKTGSEWLADVMPQSQALDCGGWRCQCQLIRTETPASEL